MAITNYTTLQTAIGDWLHRSDLTAMIPDFIAIAESNLSADLDSRQMETRDNLTTTGGNAYVTLPDDLLEVRRATVQASAKYVLRYRTPDELDVDFPTSSQGIPTSFTVIGSEMQLGPIPDAAYTIEIAYRKQLAALSNTNTTNWLLTKWPDAYLYAALLAAQPYIKDDERFPLIQSLYGKAVANINSVDWYSGSTMTVKAK